MRIAEIENGVTLTEGKVKDFIDGIHAFSQDFRGAFKQDIVFRTLVIGMAVVLGFIGIVGHEGMKKASYYKAVDEELHQLYNQYAGTNKYLDLEAEFAKYLELKALAAEKKIVPHTYYDAVQERMVTSARSVPKYPEKVVELAEHTKMLIDKYNIVVEK